MAEYTIKDVIIDPEDSRAEVGKEYYFALGAQACVDRANRDSRATELLAIDKSGEYHPFISDGEKDYPFIIRKKESPYAERQAKWIADNGIKVGDKVRIVRKADPDEDGWNNSWNTAMDDSVGKIGVVTGFEKSFQDRGIRVSLLKGVTWLYPYFVLEKIEPQYVPYDLSMEGDRARLRGAWVRKKGEVMESQVTSVGAALVSFDVGMFDTKTMLDNYEFLDGTPCGKLAEEVEA